MNRSDIIERLHELHSDIYKRDVENMVKSLFDSLAQNIASGNRVEIRGFGCFSLKTRKAGKVRNPRLGVTFSSDTRSVVYFRPGKNLRDRVLSLAV